MNQGIDAVGDAASNAFDSGLLYMGSGSASSSNTAPWLTLPSSWWGSASPEQRQTVVMHGREIAKILSPQKELPSSTVIEEIQDNAEQTQLVKSCKKSSPVEVTPTKRQKW